VINSRKFQLLTLPKDRMDFIYRNIVAINEAEESAIAIID
jgi:hypothetical protein